MRTIYTKARGRQVRIVFPEGNQPKIMQAARILREEGICEPVLLGKPSVIRELMEAQQLDELKDLTIIDPAESDRLPDYMESYYRMRQRHGLSLREARLAARRRNVFASLMLHHGEVDGMVTGLTMSYPEAVRPPLEIVRTRNGRRAGGVYLLVFKNEFKFLADCTVNVDPTSEELAEIAINTADLAAHFDVTPRVALLSYANFGSAEGPSPRKVRKALELIRKARPELQVDGEMQVDAALVPEIREQNFPFSALEEPANVLIFPNLDSANIGYKLLWRLGNAEVIGPVLLNMNRPVNVLQLGSSVKDIVNLAAVTALRAQGDQFAY
ncbi:MAG: phosphate acyltransferase [Myxococcales bacterium]